jgi:diacylglycerol kinase (ATP)
MESKMPSQILATLKNIPRRASSAMRYSLQGLSSALAKEEAFRLEAIALILLVATLAPIPWPAWKKAALVAAYFLVPLAELMNSAIEDLCDLISPGFNEKIKTAKDKGSAAVLLAILADLGVLAALILCP